MGDFESTWFLIRRYAGQKFYRVRDVEFIYRVEKDYVIPSDTGIPIPKKHFEEAAVLIYSTGKVSPAVPARHLRGLSYLYAILTDRRIHRQL